VFEFALNMRIIQLKNQFSGAGPCGPALRPKY
jgi:hypothetical protein